MQQQFQPEETLTPTTASPAAPPTTLATETAADMQAEREIMERMYAAAEKTTQRFALSLGVVSACMASALLFVSQTVSSRNPLAASLLLLLLAAGSVAALLMSWDWLRTFPKFDAAEMARFGGMKAISPLLIASQSPFSRKQHKAVQDALIMLLPQMKVSDAHLLTPAARGIIYLSLNPTISAWASHACNELRLAMLKAL